MLVCSSRRRAGDPVSARRLSTTYGSVSVRASQLSAGSAGHLSGGDDLLLCVVQRGTLELTASREEDRLIRAGEAVFVSARRVFEPVALAKTDLVMITGPEELSRDVSAVFSDGCFRLQTRDCALLEPTTAFAVEALRAGGHSNSRLGSYYIERLLQEMLQGLLADTGRVARAPRRTQDPFRRALSVLSTQCSDPTLTTNDLAESMHISRRQLEREFQKHGTTIRGELRRIRIERAVDMLRDPDYTVLSLQQIAQHVGYSGASSLTRAMVREGHQSPSRLPGSGGSEPEPR